MKKESITMKLVSTVAILTGVIITSYGIKDTGWESEEIYCAGPGFIIGGIIMKFWYRDVFKNNKLETLRMLVKISEFLFFTIGIIVFSYGLKDTSWRAEEKTIIGGVLLACGYCLREWTIVKIDHSISNSSKIYFVLFAISVFTFLSSIYSNSEDCNCEDKLNDIENKIENLERY